MTTEYVAELLQEKNIPFNISGKDYLVKCLNPDHTDSNPSMRIDKTTGIFNCFSCGFKGNVFKYFGVLTNQTFIKTAKLKEKLAVLKAGTQGLEFPVSVPFTSNFRGISSQTLKKFEAFYFDRENKVMIGFEDRIIFPIRDITGKIIMFIGRHTLSNGNPKYLNYPHGVTIPLFPAKVSKGTNSIILVEGIFDFLNCYDKGLENVVCTFGTGTMYKNTKDKLIPYKVQGVTKVYIMFDGDKAGRDAAAKLKPLIEELDFQVEIIQLEDDQDPGEMSQDYVDSIKEYTNGLHSN